MQCLKLNKITAIYMADLIVKMHIIEFTFLQGHFQIIYMSGSYMTTDEAGTRTRTGDLSIAVSSPEGHVFGGPVGGVLVAATTVQVLLFRVLITYAPPDYFSRPALLTIGFWFYCQGTI
jgi:Plants and Prokaryotes Conserved (PCC) domain